MKCDDFFRILCGPVGGGKTTGGIVFETVRRAIQMPKHPDGFRRSRFAIIRNTKPQLKDTTIKDFLKWFPPGEVGRWKESEATFYLEIGDVRSEILFRALDTPDDIQRVLSLQLTGAAVEECREIHPEIIDALQGRLGRYPSVGEVPEYWSGLWGVTNPPEEGSWWYKVMEGIPVEDGNEDSIVPCTTFIQPSGVSTEAENVENLRVGYYERLMRGKTQDWIDTYIHGKYSPSLSGVPVFGRCFKADKHVASEPLKIYPNLPVIVGMDFGRTPAAVFKQVMPNGRVHVVREIVTFNTSLTNFVKYHMRPLIANAFPSNHLILVGDPAGSIREGIADATCFKFLRDEFASEGYTVKSAQTNKLQPRLEATERMLTQFPGGDPFQIIDPCCKWTIEAFRSKYRFAKPKNTDFFSKESPDKNDWSHIADANQYADLYILGGRFNISDYEQPAGMSFNPLANPTPSFNWRPALDQGY